MKSAVFAGVVLGSLGAFLVAQFSAPFVASSLAGALGNSQEAVPPAMQEAPTPPNSQPEVLGAGFVSRPDRYEFCQTLSRDGRTLTIGVEHGQWQSIESYSWDGAQWVGPKPVIGKPNYNAHDPYLSADEQRLYFITKVRGTADLAYLPREIDGSWGEAVFLDAPVNSDSDDYYTSITKNGAVFLSSNRGGQGFDLYEAPLEGGEEAIRLPDGINMRAYEGDPFIDPDRRYLIFASNRRDGAGRGDIYLSVAKEDGGWSHPIAFDERVNTKGHELCPQVSLDGSAFMFTSNEDIYWVSSAIIDEMIAAYEASAEE
ncbi:MAG: hypothetical protein AAF559_00710 [Pseudomonadota bacterium]